MDNLKIVKAAMGRLLCAYTKPYQVDYGLLTNLIVVDNRPAGKGVLKFPLSLFNGMEIKNDKGGLN